MPTIHVIAGPNGVGKTTFATQFLPEEVRQLEFVNADLIARGLSPFDPEAAAIEAGRIALRRIRQLIDRGAGFAWETTLSGRGAVVWLQKARTNGFTVKCHFLWVRCVEIVLARVLQRVAEGGHVITEETSRRRFFKTIQNLFTIYRPHFDSWKLYENDLTEPRLVAVEKHGRLVVRDRARFAQILTDADVKI